MREPEMWMGVKVPNSWVRVPHRRMGVPEKRVGASNGWARAPDR